MFLSKSNKSTRWSKIKFISNSWNSLAELNKIHCIYSKADVYNFKNV